MKKEKKKPYFVSDSLVKSISVDGYDISFESTPSPYFLKLSLKEREAYLDLLHKAQLTPKGCLKKVLELRKTCSNSPEVDNLLTYLYTLEKNIRKAEALIEESYKKYPSYFLAKINYADQLLRTKQLQRFKEIIPFDDLKKLYPKQTPYHVTEFRSFMILQSNYFLAMKNSGRALYFYDLAKQADPAHPSLIALEKKIFPSKRKWFFLRLISLIQRISKRLYTRSC